MPDLGLLACLEYPPIVQNGLGMGLSTRNPGSKNEVPLQSQQHELRVGIGVGGGRGQVLEFEAQLLRLALQFSHTTTCQHQIHGQFGFLQSCSVWHEMDDEMGISPSNAVSSLVKVSSAIGLDASARSRSTATGALTGFMLLGMAERCEEERSA